MKDMRTGIGILAVLLLVGGGCFFLGRVTAPVDPDGDSAASWLEPSPESDTARDQIKEKNLELLGQIMLLKKMLGEIEGELLLMGPIGKSAVSRGRLVWDPARMEGFLHAVQLPEGSGQWTLEIINEGELLARCPLPAPDEARRIQAVFRPEARILAWDRFQVVCHDDNNQKEVVLAGVRP